MCPVSYCDQLAESGCVCVRCLRVMWVIACDHRRGHVVCDACTGVEPTLPAAMLVNMPFTCMWPHVAHVCPHVTENVCDMGNCNYEAWKQRTRCTWQLVGIPRAVKQALKSPDVSVVKANVPFARADCWKTTLSFESVTCTCVQ